jgi:CBS domain-containing protein
VKPVRSVIGDRQVVVADSFTSASEAARLMAARQIGALVIIDDNRLAGIVTERDFLTRVVAANRDPSTTPLGQIMSSQLVVASAAESCQACLQRMQQAHVRHLIVLDEGALLGIVSLRDLMAVDLDEKAEAIDLLNAYVHHVPAYVQVNRQT